MNSACMRRVLTGLSKYVSHLPNEAMNRMSGMKLIITEKNTTAKRISTILSDGKPGYGKTATRSTASNERGRGALHRAQGHILKVDFPSQYQQWQDVNAGAHPRRYHQDPHQQGTHQDLPDRGQEGR